jgi:hypothetical protein
LLAMGNACATNKATWQVGKAGEVARLEGIEDELRGA